jgi:hypothetical protein
MLGLYKLNKVSYEKGRLNFVMIPWQTNCLIAIQQSLQLPGLLFLQILFYSLVLIVGVVNMIEKERTIRCFICLKWKLKCYHEKGRRPNGE